MKGHGWNPEAQQERYIELQCLTEKTYDGQKMTVEQGYEAAGEMGKYHVLLALASAISMISCMIYIFSVPLFLVKPKFTCSNGDCSNVCSANGNYTYEDKHFNFVTEFDLLCDSYSGTIIEVSFGVCSLIGCVLFSTLSDSVGRLPVIILGITGNIICISLILYFPTYHFCVIFSAILGLFIAALATPTYTFLYDSVLPCYIAFYGTYLNICFAFGEVIVGFVLWTGASWRTMCYVIICWSAMYYILLIWLKEAPRYLLSKKKEAKALANLQAIARFNSKKLPENIYLSAEGAGCVTEQTVSCGDTVKLLLEISTLCRVLMCMLLFFCCGSVYYGISMNLQRFPGNVYVNAMLNGIVEVIAVMTSGVIMNHFGKRRAFILAFGVTGLFMVFQTFAHELPYPLLSTINIAASKFGISAAFNLIYIMVGEMFPSAAKNTVFGICIITERLGCASGPVLGVNPILFSTVSAGLCFGAAMVACFMPLQAASAKISPI